MRTACTVAVLGLSLIFAGRAHAQAACPAIEAVKIAPTDPYVGEFAAAGITWKQNTMAYSGNIKWKISIKPDEGTSPPDQESEATGSTRVVPTSLDGQVTVTATMPAFQTGIPMMGGVQCPESSGSATVQVKPVTVTDLVLKYGTALQLTTRNTYTAVRSPAQRGQIALQWYWRKHGDPNWNTWLSGTNPMTATSFVYCETVLGSFDIKVTGTSGRKVTSATKTTTVSPRPSKLVGTHSYRDHWDGTLGVPWGDLDLTAEYPPIGVPVCRDDLVLILTVTRSAGATPRDFDAIRGAGVDFAGKFTGDTNPLNKYRYFAQHVNYDIIAEDPPTVDGFVYARKARATFLLTPLGISKNRTPFVGHLYGTGANAAGGFLLTPVQLIRFAIFRWVWKVDWTFLDQPPPGEDARYTDVTPSDGSWAQCVGLDTATPNCPERQWDLWH
jgi:hypothetical protein